MPKSRLTRARKQHICKFCGLPIIDGTIYSLQTFKVSDGPTTHHYEHHRYHSACDWNRKSPSPEELFKKQTEEAYRAMEVLYGQT